jgi:hypothetical protein
MRRVVAVVVAAILLAIVVGWVMAPGLERWLRSGEPTAAVAAPPAPSAEPARKIRATLFYVSEDGTRLVGVPREVPFAETPADQARQLITEQLGPAPPPYAPPLPPGTTVRAVFLTDRNEAFVDLSPEASRAHPGGSLDELFSVYAVVNALTVNLPAVTRVQILVDGKEVDSLAGHVDLRRPLPRDLKWVERDPNAPPEPAAAPQAPAAPPGQQPGDGGR